MVAIQKSTLGITRLFQRVGSGDVLFVTNGVGDSALYRTENIAEELNLHGFCARVTVQDNPFLLKYTDRFGIFVFHRVVFTKRIESLMGILSNKGKTLIFETDDLVYDPQYFCQTEAYHNMGSAEKALYAEGLGGEILKNASVRACTTTTTYLAEKLKERGKRVFLVPNRLSQKDVHIAKEICEKSFHPAIHNSQASTPTTNITVGYFSGTASHNKDFATISAALQKIFRKYENVTLLVVGPLKLDEDLKEFSDRIVQKPYTPREKHFQNVASIDINLAPLEICNPFCESKSELKFFEAGIVGVPTIASATRTFQEAITDGVDGFVAQTTEEWIKKLSQLIENKDLREKMGELAYKKTMRDYTTENAHNDEYYSYLRDCIQHEA